MDIYLVPGTATTYSPISAQEAGNSFQLTGVNAAGMNTSCQVIQTIAGSSETSKGNVKRIMLKTSLPIPIGLLVSNNNIPNYATETLSMHVVLTAPPYITALLTGVADGANITASIVTQAFDKALRAMVAMLGYTVSEPASPTVDAISHNPLYRGMLGLLPLDVMTGRYGKATA